MKKVLFIASIIGLFMATSLDLQARYVRNDQQRHGRSVISSSQSRQAPSRNRNNSYSQYGNRQGRNARGGTSYGLSRQSPMRNRTNSYSQYGDRQGRNVRGGTSYGLSRQFPMRNRYNSYSRYGNRQGRQFRGGISFGLSMYAPMLDRYNSYGGYYNHSGRYVASEIRRNEERIWILQERMDGLYRYGDNYGEIRELEQEINYLQRRNDFLRSQLY